MLKSNKRLSTEKCADCGSIEAPWASINRGVLICDDCCSVHRSLGRHISQIKALRSKWCQSQLGMLQCLVASDANNIWECTLTEGTLGKLSKRKPSYKDALHPTKANFIRAKYESLQYAYKGKDSDIYSTEELNKKLYNCVKTINVDQSLRLIHLGADPNFYDPESGNSPMHIAAEFGQIWQIELLFVWGADPGCYNAHGLTPVDLAKKKCHVEIMDRLIECQYELTDRLAFYLCGRKPDHKNGQHFLIPEMVDNSSDNTDLAKAAKKKLQALSNHLFEELAMDVYDEVDRRELDGVWLQTQNHSSVVSDNHSVPFLPVNSEFTSTRNQGRQKLARFNAREFTNLIIDILSDARRREQVILNSKLAGAQNEHPKKSKRSSLSDDEPLYDSVASDEDYASAIESSSKITDPEKKSLELSLPSSSPSDVSLSVVDLVDMKKELMEQKAKVHELACANHELKNQVNDMSHKLKKLMQENSELRNGANPEHLRPSLLNGHDIVFGNESDDYLSNSKASTSRSNSSESGTLPTQDDVIKRTEKITKRIQELLRCAQEAKYEAYGLCSEKIFSAVYDMMALFSNAMEVDRIQMVLSQLKNGANQLKQECNTISIEDSDLKVHTQTVIQCAYDIAKAAKALVVLFE